MFGGYISVCLACLHFQADRNVRPTVVRNAGYLRFLIGGLCFASPAFTFAFGCLRDGGRWWWASRFRRLRSVGEHLPQQRREVVVAQSQGGPGSVLINGLLDLPRQRQERRGNRAKLAAGQHYAAAALAVRLPRNTRLATARKVTAESKVCSVNMRRTNSCARPGVVHVSAGDHVQAGREVRPPRSDCRRGLRPRAGVGETSSPRVGLRWPILAARAAASLAVRSSNRSRHSSPRARLGLRVPLWPVRHGEEQPVLIDAQPAPARLTISRTPPRSARLNLRVLGRAVKAFVAIGGYQDCSATRHAVKESQRTHNYFNLIFQHHPK